MKKSNSFFKILIALLLLCCVIFVGIPLVAKYFGFYDKPDGSIISDDDSHSVKTLVTDDSRVISSVIPEDVSNRGIILRGILDDSDPRFIFRYSVNGTYNWIDDYTCGCNLTVSSSDEEFMDYCDSFSGFDDPFYAELNGNSYYTCDFRVPYKPVNVVEDRIFEIQFFRSGIYGRDVSNGEVMIDADTGIKAPVFYDPTGKYIMMLNPSYRGNMMDDFMLAFLEPEMVKLEISTLGESGYSTEEPEEIRNAKDCMHLLELSKVDEEMPELAMAENQTTITFTDVNGNVNDYVVVGEYLVSRDIIYHIENRNVLDDLMAIAESSQTLPSRSDFENLDKESSEKEIIEQFGNGGYEGSGIIYRVWHLDDGSKAKLVFNSKGEIEFIYIVTDDLSERIYDRDNS